MNYNINEFYKIEILKDLLNITLFQKLNTEGYVYCKNIFEKYNKEYIEVILGQE